MGNIVSLDSVSSQSRAGELEPPPDRSNRFINNDGAWFYKTRENQSIGPYPNRPMAEKAAKAFAGFAKSLTGDSLDQLIGTHLKALSSNDKNLLQQPLRLGEWEVPDCRSTRVYQGQGKWYFRTREGSVVGPYESESEAESAVKLFTEFAETINEKAIVALISTMNEGL